MKLKYAGPRPIISHHGVNFKEGKEDKYVYLHFAIDILESLDEDFKNDGNYSHIVNEHTLSDDEMQDIIAKYHPNLQEVMLEEIEAYDKHLFEEVQLAYKKSTLEVSEREAFVSNLEVMHDYRLQRAKNKIFYRHIIQTISEFIKDKKIKEIDTPFSEKFWHILQTISGEISLGKVSFNSHLKVEKNGDELIAKLTIDI